MNALTTIGKAEKNALYTDSAFVLLLEIQLNTPVYLAYCQSEDIEWNGHTWIKFPMTLDNQTDDTESDPKLTLGVANASRELQQAIEANGGGIDTGVILRVVNTKNLGDTECDLELEFVVNECNCDKDWITFTLGCEYSARTIRPLYRFMKDFCPFKYKSVKCGYNGALTTCNKTLTDCRAHSNSTRFGGFPGIDQKGAYL